MPEPKEAMPIPPERELEYIQNAEAAANEAGEAAMHELGVEAAKGMVDHVNSFAGVAEGAEHVAQNESIHADFMDTMDAARLGVPGLVVAGRATPEDIVDHANSLLAQGMDPNEINAQVLEMQTAASSVHGKQRAGLLESGELAAYGNSLLDAGLEPGHAERLVNRAANPATMAVPEDFPGPPRE